MSKKLSVDDLDPMHAKLAEHFNDILTHGEKYEHVDRETGEVSQRRRAPSAATLNQIRQFLKDNGVEAAPTSKRVQNLVSGLPFQGDDDEDPMEAPSGVH